MKKIKFQIRTNKESDKGMLSYQTNSKLPYSESPDFVYEFENVNEIDRLIVNLYMLKKAYCSEV